MAKCITCGAEAPDASVFCPACGTKLEQTASAIPEPIVGEAAIPEPIVTESAAAAEQVDATRQVFESDADMGGAQSGNQSGADMGGAQSGNQSGSGSAASGGTNFSEQFNAYFKTERPNLTPDEQKDVNDNKVMSILAYLGLLVFIPMFAAKDSKFTRHHVNNGLWLLICEAAVSVLSVFNGLIFPLRYASWYSIIPTRPGIYHVFSTIYYLIYAFIVVLIVFGIIHAVQGRKKDLPLVGQIKLVK